MFSKATADFVRRIDNDGSLIHVSRLNDSEKLFPMALVIKRNRFWLWQRPKYNPTDFTLGDLLLGGDSLSPGVNETTFLTYKETGHYTISGKVDATVGYVNASVEGQGTSRHQSCFCNLKREELDVKKLLHDSSNRLVNMQHRLVKQMEKGAEVLTIVKDRILTTSSCTITQMKNRKCTFQGVLSLLGMLRNLVKEARGVQEGNIEIDSDVSLVIPSNTVIAYSVRELKITKSGHYDICLQPGKTGGIEADSAIETGPYVGFLNEVDGKCNGLQESDLAPLAELHPLTQGAFFKTLQEIMSERTALSILQCELEKQLCEETFIMSEQENLQESEKDSASAMLEQSDSDGHAECFQAVSSAHVKAVYLLVSALEELPDEALSTLSESDADFLEAFDTLIWILKESEGPLTHGLPVLLQDNQAFQRAEQLLSFTDVTLKRNSDGLWMETGDKAGVLPSLLSLSVRGLSLLCKGPK